MEVRVRAVAITDEGRLVVIRRQKVGRPAYRVFPGGGVRLTDQDEVSALMRELNEEISGEATVHQPIYCTERRSSSGELRREIFYICRLLRFSLQGGSGPEWRHFDPDNRYIVESIGMDEAALLGANLLPGELVEILVAASDPFDLPSIDA